MIANMLVILFATPTLIQCLPFSFCLVSSVAQPTRGTSRRSEGREGETGGFTTQSCFGPETVAGAAFLCDCSFLQAAVLHPSLSAPGHTFSSPFSSASGWEGGFEYFTSPICSLNVAQISVRSPFLKVSSFELLASKFCFLLCPGRIGVT